MLKWGVLIDWGLAMAVLTATFLWHPDRLPGDETAPTNVETVAVGAPALIQAVAAPYEGSFPPPAPVYEPHYPPDGTVPAQMIPVGTADPYISGTPPAPAMQPFFNPYAVDLFDSDFSFKNIPGHEWFFNENLKDIDLRKVGLGHVHIFTVGDCDDLQDITADEFLPLSSCPAPLLFSTGGEFRLRYMDEANRLRPGKPARGKYELLRWRQYVDLKVDDWLRVYAEMIDASMDNNSLPATQIDVNRWDLQNLFLELKLMEFGNGRQVWSRPGRQELTYGSQRLVSSYDWANTRRNFEGLKFYTHGSDWDFDAWFTRPVNTATTGDGPFKYFSDHFDSPNMNHTFSGTWFTYKALQDQIVDLYWLWDFNSKLVQPGFAGGDRHTIGGRWFGNLPVGDAVAPVRTFHGEVEGGYQFGSDFAKNVSAGFLTAGAGHTWNNLPWEPNFWIYYDWASGSQNLKGKTTNTFGQLYGDWHSFLGQIDNIGRQNINDYNAKVTVKPLKQVALQTQYHWFDLANSHDVLYTFNGAPFGKPNTGTHVGQELDISATYNVTPFWNVQAGYFRFWYGQFVEKNSPRGNAEQIYIQTSVHY